MVWVVIGAFVTGGSALVLLAVLVAMRLHAYRTAADTGRNESDDISLVHYQPMARLLAEEDFQFLAAQPGYRPEMGAKFRRERTRIFRMYLRELARDFHRLHAQARAILAESPEQHGEMVGVLIRQQLNFWRAIAGVEVRLVAVQAGMGKLDVGRLVGVVEAMRIDVARLSGPAAASA
jgi:hypothetical protein